MLLLAQQRCLLLWMWRPRRQSGCSVFVAMRPLYIAANLIKSHGVQKYKSVLLMDASYVVRQLSEP
jgi:hypothetical protein